MLGSTAVLDACVLVPVALADTMLRVAEKGLYRPLWSDRILREAQLAIEEIHPGITVDRRFDSMREAFSDALVTGWEALEPRTQLPDRDDRHVVAAAVCGGADAIIPVNLADFPAAALGPLGREAIHPDDFLLDQLDLSPPAVLQVIREQSARTRNPQLTQRDLASALGRAGIPRFADEVLRQMAGEAGWDERAGHRRGKRSTAGAGRSRVIVSGRPQGRQGCGRRFLASA